MANPADLIMKVFRACGLRPAKLWVLSLLLMSPAWAADSFELSPVMQGLPLGLYFDTFEDSEASLTLEDILKIDASGGFQRSFERVPNYGLNPSVQWVRFTLHNSMDQPVPVILENYFTFVDRFTLYYQTPEKSWASKEAGDQVPFSNREIRTRQVAYRFHLEPGTHLFYARTVAVGAHQLPLLIWTQDEFFEHNAEEYAMIGILLGIHVVICLYNLFLFYSLKDRTYFIYIVYVFCNLFYQAVGLGIFQHFLNGFSSLEFVPNEIMIVSVDLVAMSALYFSYLFLNIRKRLPRFTRLYVAIGILDVLNIFVTLFVSIRFGTTICLLNASLVVSILLLSGVLIARQGYRPALFYMAAWSWYIVGVAGTLSNLVGIIPTNAFTRWGQFVGGGFEVAILSLALGARINEKRRKQVQKINELNQALETKVAELLNETDCRKSMAAKAAHHLNNPIQAIAGLAENTMREEKNIWKRLETMFPEAVERTPEVQDVITSFHQSFQSIEQNSAMTLQAIKRASVISNELRIMSGIHGIEIQRVTLGEFWNSLATEIKDDETLGSRLISFEDLPQHLINYAGFIERLSFTKSIFYVLKEGLEAVPNHTPVRISLGLHTPEFDQPRLLIRASATEGIKEVDASAWREVKFCQHLLNRFGATVSVLASREMLMIDVGLPPKGQTISGAA
jgi:signal transduction histidine kinase